MRDRSAHSADRCRFHRLVPDKIKLPANAAHWSEVRDQTSEVRGPAPKTWNWTHIQAGLISVFHKRQSTILQMKSAKDLIVYKKAYELAMQVFYASKSFPKEEQYSLTDQIRRSSRSVCSNLREAWAKRRYEAHFVSKLTYADGENAET